MQLFSLWFGKKVGYLEQLTLASAMAVGHAVTVYSYDLSSLTNLPSGVALADANEVMSDPGRTRLFRDGHMALGSDFFRYEALAQGRGCWIDLDLIFLRPLPQLEFLFGWENGASINGAVLRLPAGSLLDELRMIPAKNWLPPYFGPLRTLKYWSARLRGPVPLEDLPWGSAGPAMITYLIEMHGLEAKAQPTDVFYPLPYESARLLYSAPGLVEEHLSDRTVTIHMWNSKLRELAKSPPPPASYIARMCSQFGIDVAS